jgi:colicin import membrane protein
MRKSFGFANSFGPRAGACAQQLACVFRSVELGDGPAFVQPVDLRVIHHDRREMKQVAADDSCRVEGGRLTCARAVRADNYTLWIVPESVAQAAGGDLLSRAIAEGLVASRAAEVPWQPQR